MITLVSGKIGCGKSYYMVGRILEHLENRGIVATNITLKNVEKYKNQIMYISGNSSPTDLPSGDRRGTKNQRKVMIVFDESQSWFGVQQGKIADPRKELWSDWLRHSDKLGQDIFLIAQEWTQIAKWFRILAQRVIFCHHSKNERIISLLPFPFLYTAEKNVNEVENETVGRRAKSIKFTFSLIRKKIYKHYETAETYESEKYESENIYDKMIIAPSSPLPDLAQIFTISFIFFLVFLFLNFRLGISDFEKEKKNMIQKMQEKVTIKRQQRKGFDDIFKKGF